MHTRRARHGSAAEPSERGHHLDRPTSQPHSGLARALLVHERLGDGGARRRWIGLAGKSPELAESSFGAQSTTRGRHGIAAKRSSDSPMRGSNARFSASKADALTTGPIGPRVTQNPSTCSPNRVIEIDHRLWGGWCMQPQLLCAAGAQASFAPRYADCQVQHRAVAHSKARAQRAMRRPRLSGHRP